MAQLYGPLLERVWRDALLLPGFDDLFLSLASEVATFHDWSADHAAHEMERAWRQRPDESRKRFPAEVTEESLAEFYADSNTSMLVSAYWHSLRPDRYALHGVAALRAIEMYADGDRVFEVGHGIGSTALLLARHGLAVTAGDVSDTYIAFMRQRFAQRNLACQSVDLRDGYPERGAHDVVVCLDVLEHVLDPLGLVSSMLDAVTDNGLVVLNVAFGLDPDTPEHLLSSRRGFLDRLRAFGLEPIPHPTLQLFWKRPQASWERPIRRMQDTAAVLAMDIGARLPRARRVLERSMYPPVRHHRSFSGE